MKNNKRIDDILMSAFGEYDGDLGNMTEADRREYEQVWTLREGLASLRDVPECQLSNERLRNAILGSAVEPQRRFNPWGLAAAGIACLAVALLFMQKSAPVEEGTSVAMSDIAPGAADSTSALSGTENAAVPTKAQPEPTMTRPAPRQDARVATNTAPSKPSADYSEFIADFGAILKGLDFGDDTTLEVASSPAGSTPREPVVVVDPSTRTRNGAAMATEVASYGDVVIGG